MDVKTIEINLSDSSHTVNGSPLYDLYKEFQKRIGNIQNANEKQELIEDYSEIIEQNNNNAIGQIMYERLLVRLTSPNDSVLFYKVYNSGSEAWKKKYRYFVRRINDNIELSKKNEREKYMDFRLQSINGDTLLLSDLIGKNKHLKIIFWALWCGPCIAKIPAYIQSYQIDQKKDWTYISVSMDEDHEAWKEAFKKNDMPWEQYVLKVNGDELAKMRDFYSLRAIPFELKMDENGFLIR